MKTYFFNGEYLTAKEIKDKYNKPNEFLFRLKSGWNFNEAFYSSYKPSNKNFEFNGFKGNLKEICDHFKLNYPKIYNIMAENFVDFRGALLILKNKNKVGNHG